jgi:hypothetical protein
MTNRTGQTLPQDFPIEVAENEGMPPGPDSRGFSPPFAPTRRVSGTPMFGLSKTRTAIDGLMPARERPMRRNGVQPTRPLARLIARITVAAGVIASLAFPVFAQDCTGPSAQSAQSRSDGGGWDCDLGYRVEGAECLALDIPDVCLSKVLFHIGKMATPEGLEPSTC